MPETMYKMFEHMRLINDEMVSHLEVQKTKKHAIEAFEQQLLKDSDYALFIGQIKQEDATLFEISQKFTDLTSEAKRILDSIKGKSDQRKEEKGGENNFIDHHKPFPRDVMTGITDLKTDVTDATEKVSEYIRQQNTAVRKLQESKDRVVEMRK